MRMSLPPLILLLSASAALANDLGSAPSLLDRTSHRASSYDRSGGNTDSLMSIEPGSTHVLLETDGPGRINHIWMTLAVFPKHETFLRDLVVRMFWEHAPVPSVEVPLGDFFGMGHNRMYTYSSAPLTVGSSRSAMNCYWPMPFYRHARIEIVNTGQRSIRRLYYHIDYELGEIPPGQGLFHAMFTRDRAVRGQRTTNLSGEGNFVALDIQGRGQYMGCLLEVDGELAERWYEGDEMIFIDGDPARTIYGTGTEDYFSNAWGYTEAFSNLYYGAPLLERRPDGGIYACMYRWHIPDPIRFRKSIKVTFEHLFDSDLINDYAAVCYWYAAEPIASRPPLPEKNYPLVRKPRPAPAVEFDTAEFEAPLREAGIKARSISAELHDGFTSGGYLQIETEGRAVTVVLSVPDDDAYRVLVKPVNRLIQGSMQAGIDGGELRTIARVQDDAGRTPHESRTPYADLGVARAEGGRIRVVLRGDGTIGIDQIRCVRVKPERIEQSSEPGQ